MKVLTLREIRLRFRLSKVCAREIQKLYLFGASMGALAGFALGLGFWSLVSDCLIFFNLVFNLTNDFLNRIDLPSMILGLFLGGAMFFCQHWSAHHTAKCCKKHNLKCTYQL